MTAFSTDFAFLQSFYEQDTLYVLPADSQQEIIVEEAAKPVMTTVTAPVDIPVPCLATDQKENISANKSEAPPVVSSAHEKISWLGEALKGTYLLFQVPPDDFQQLPQHLFLQKVMAAVGLTTKQIRFGNLSAAMPHNIKQIAQEQQARHILLFGEELTVENLLKLEPYRMYKLDETRFVRVDSLAHIEQNHELKKKLWNVLQKIFL